MGDAPLVDILSLKNFLINIIPTFTFLVQHLWYAGDEIFIKFFCLVKELDLSFCIMYNSTMHTEFEKNFHWLSSDADNNYDTI